MKLTKIAAMAFGCAALMASCTGNVKEAAKSTKVKTAKDTFNYAMGYNYGQGLLDQLKQMPITDAEGKILDKEAVIKGFAEALYGDSTMTEDAMKQSADKFFTDMIDQEKAKAAAAYAEIAKKYEALGFTSLGKPSDPRFASYDGPTVYMKVEAEGQGDTIKMTDFAYMDYEGKLAVNDTIFDSTTGKEPTMLTPGRVIPGFSQALCKLKEGSKATFLIPSDLGYGPREMGPIPANSPLVFTVDIKKVFHNDADAKKFMEKLHPELKDANPHQGHNH